MKTILYSRKSSEADDRQALSLESQIHEMTALVEKRGIKIDKVFTESMSAKAPGRPVFNEMLKYIAKHKGVTIVTWKLDRLARNPIDDGQVKWLLQTGVIAEIITCEKSYYPNDNVLSISVESAMSTQYSRDLSINVKRGIKTKLLKGEYPGRAPFGYLNDKVEHKIIVDPERSAFIVRAFEMYATGKYSLKAITEKLYSEGLRTKSGFKFQRNLLHRMLRNPFYYGFILHNQELYSGNHTALISKQIFDQVQDVLSGKKRVKIAKHFFPLRGYFNCATCGCVLTPTRKREVNVYYYCTNGKGNCAQHKSYLRAQDLNAMVAGVFQKLQFDTEMIEITYLAAKEKYENNTSTTENQKAKLEKQLKTLEQRTLQFADTLIDQPSLKTTLEAKILSLESEQGAIREQIKRLGVKTTLDPKATLEQTKKAFLQANSSFIDYINADDHKQKKLLEILLWNIGVQDKQIAYSKLKQPYQVMLETAKPTDLNSWLG